MAKKQQTLTVVLALIAGLASVQCSYVHAAETGLTDKAGDPMSVITCTFGEFAYFSVKDGKLKVEPDKENWSIVIAALDTDTPKMKGNMGESPLLILGRYSDIIYLAERTPLGNMIYITIFTKQGIVTFSKQYIIAGQIMAYMCIGRFK